ncbi:MAG: PAS domain S-box protein [Paludibacter sp.]|nr:PAS domain S-box protein [Paludibacter sp.]
MKNSFIHPKIDIPRQDINELQKVKVAENESQQPQNVQTDFNETLLSSLPYPAMYVRQKDRIILAANEFAINFGAKIGGHCWREFGKTDFISKADTEIATKFPNLVPNEFNIKCSFCLGDECILDSPCQNNPEVNAFGRIWDTYWIKVSDEVFLHYLIDITERKKLEESLRESEEFLKQTQQISMLGSYNLDISSGNWVSSEVMDNIFGIDSNFKKTFESWLSIIHPEMREMMSNYFNTEVIGNKKGFNKEYKIKRKNDGEERWVHGLGDLKFNENNEPIKMIGTIRDITERKQEQSRIIRNLQFTEVLLKSIPIPVFFIDTNGLYTGCNEAFSNQLGISNEDVKGKSVMDLWPGKQSKMYFLSDLDIIVNKEFKSYETTIIDKNNQERNVILIKNVYFDELGQAAGIVGTYVDITEQKKRENALRKSENKYKLLSENITDGIFTCKNGYIEYVNRSMSIIFSCDEARLEGKKLTQLIIPERRNDFEAFISFDPSSDQVTNIEIECLKDDNSIVFVEMFLNYVASEKTIYGVMHDITKKKILQEKNIIKAIIQTEEKERAYFSKELHDGLGPLLSTIKLYLQWSVRPKTNKSRKEIILKAEEILEEALTTVKEISNKLSPLLLQNYGLTSAVQSFVNKLGDTNAIKIEFYSNITRRIEMEIEVALYRAIIECVNNTIKYAKAKQIHIQMIDTGNHIQLQYRDDGKGFDIVKILSEKKGLGLYNLQNRIQTIGGEIKMFSKPHEGVNFRINVPVK